MLSLIIPAIITLILSYTSVALFQRWALHRMLDIPNERSSHTRPTPRGGGIAIVSITIIGSLISLIIMPTADWMKISTYLIGAIIIATVSWFDDIRSLPNTVRFGAHTIGALLVIATSGFWQVVHVPIIGDINLHWLGLPITFLWIVGLTNAYNFMDGIDGIAGSQAVIAGIGWAIIGWIIGYSLLSILGILIAFSSLGFLGHNWHPARIFMGDVGSAFLGYTFAVLTLTHQATVMPLVGFLLVWTFVFDAAFTFLRRLSKGENVFASHRTHLYQRLVIAGYTHRTVTLLYSILACIGGILAILWARQWEGSTIAILFTLPILCLGLWLTVTLAERRGQTTLHHSEAT